MYNQPPIGIYDSERILSVVFDPKYPPRIPISSRRKRRELSGSLLTSRRLTILYDAEMQKVKCKKFDPNRKFLDKNLKDQIASNLIKY